MHRYMILSVVMLTACAQQQKERKASLLDEVKYASGFQLLKDGEETIIQVTQPWPGAKDTLSYTPGLLKKVVCTSTTHLSFLEMLNEEESLIGFPNTSYIYAHKFRDRLNSGKILDIGQENAINLELLISLDPDAVFAFDTGRESTSLDKVREAGITVIYVPDFLEQSPLGRAEWIKFFGVFFDKMTLADSIFHAIETEYLYLRSSIQDIGFEERPSILSGIVYGDHWFLPGGQNWGSIFFKDGGGHYLWEENLSNSWLELSFETVFEKASNADFWIGTSTHVSLSELATQESRYAHFNAFKKGNIFNYSKRRNEFGGNDYFESGYARPDIVLKDLISIIHPELLPDYETVYFEKLR